MAISPFSYPYRFRNFFVSCRVADELSLRQTREMKTIGRLREKMIECGEDYYELHRTVSSYAATNNIDPSEVRLVGIEYPQDLDW